MPVSASRSRGGASRRIRTTGINRRANLLDALERELRIRGMRGRRRARLPSPASSSSARWWWEFHQAAVAIVYAVMVWPTWFVRNQIGGRPGNAVFCGVLAAASSRSRCGLHLWFTSRFLSGRAWLGAGALDGVGARLRRPVCDDVIVAGVLVGDQRPALAVLEIRSASRRPHGVRARRAGHYPGRISYFPTVCRFSRS